MGCTPKVGPTNQQEGCSFHMPKLRKEERGAAVEAGESIAQIAKQYQIHESVLMTNVRQC